MMIGNILDNTTELYMIKYTFGEIFSSGRATLYKNPSDHTVQSQSREGTALKNFLAYYLNLQTLKSHHRSLTYLFNETFFKHCLNCILGQPFMNFKKPAICMQQNYNDFSFLSKIIQVFKYMCIIIHIFQPFFREYLSFFFSFYSFQIQDLRHAIAKRISMDKVRFLCISLQDNIFEYIDQKTS